MFVGIRLLLLLVAAGAIGGAGASSTAYRQILIDVDFEDRSASLRPLERQKIAAAVEMVRAEDWCGLAFVTATGHAVSSEGDGVSLQELSERRALYVAELVRELGVPKRRVFSEGKADRYTSAGWAFGRRVELLFQAEGSERQTSTPCPIPRDSNGLRVRN